MKTLILLSLIILSGTICSAQDQSPISKINQQITDYFNSHPRESIPDD